MNDLELTALYVEIERFLKGPPADPASAGSSSERDRAYWSSRPFLTAAEIGALAALIDGPSHVELLACRLGQDTAGTRRFLDALVAIGVLELGKNGYDVTPATRLYLEAFGLR